MRKKNTKKRRIKFQLVEKYTFLMSKMFVKQITFYLFVIWVTFHGLQGHLTLLHVISFCGGI